MQLIQKYVLFATSLFFACTSSSSGDTELDPLPDDILSEAELSAARAVPPYGTVAFETSNGRRYVGALTLVVAPTGAAHLALMAHDDSGAALTGELFGEDSMVRVQRNEDGTIAVRYSHTSAQLDWLSQNLGVLRQTDTGDELPFVPREVDLRVDASGLLAATITCSELLTGGDAPALGEEVVVHAAGRLTGSCLALADDGRVLMDPDGEENTACSELLSGF